MAPRGLGQVDARGGDRVRSERAPRLTHADVRRILAGAWPAAVGDVPA